MPVLKYRCNHCGKEFAKIFLTPETAPRECPVCRAPKPEALGPAFHYDAQMIKRAVCTSCDACETDEGPCSSVAST